MLFLPSPRPAAPAGAVTLLVLEMVIMGIDAGMDVVHPRCAGMDISKNDAKVCVRSPLGDNGRFRSVVTTYGATTNEVQRLRADLGAAGVSLVVMEATGDYWKPFFFPLEQSLNVQLVNAKQAKNIPGRKTDVSDAAWLAKLAAYDLLTSSFVPPESIRQLRDLTRTRTHYAQEATREFSRIEKCLEDAGIKLSSVASSLTTKSCRTILDAMVAGQRDPHVLAELVEPGMRVKNAALVEALTGRFTTHHAFLIGEHLATIDEINTHIHKFDTQIDQVMRPFRDVRDLLTTIPGFSVTVADVIIAEIGVDMDVFPTAANLASWAGVCPGQNQSAGRVKSTRTRPGNRYLKGALGIAAMSASRSKTTYLSVKYQRIAAHNSKARLKALVTIEHTMLVIIWNMIRNGVVYNELGPGYYTRRNPNKIKNAAIRQLQTLGYTVELTPATAA